MQPANIILGDLKKSKKLFKNGHYKIIFDQPYHLYLDKSQSQAYITMIEADKFSSLLHDPTLNLIEKYKHKILKGFTGKLSFYDLGPGMPTKTIPLLKQLQETGVPFDYFPVDVSENFLNITEKEINKIGITCHRINSLFEDLPKVIVNDKNEEKLFFIGLTFNNYRPDKILKLLKQLAGNDGTCLIITEYFKKKNIETILLPYRDKYAEYFNYLSLKLAGIEQEQLSYFTEFRNQRIEMGFRVLEDLQLAPDLVIEKDTEIITAISYRYSKNNLIKHINKYFSCFEFFEHNEKDISLASFKFSN
ncbi:L-histidine N(alpha)-methyltransferase [Mucilaginibacter sp. OK098]|uniref:L-histidine N(alpha)-methyltransferase n=1 Tax=Mucilaginibacter sp. OK098 TaxID=1855297 RepID=UPI00090F8875|nr:L-histidine N(alpha)-methyltransferase [Mucilaginibacter sp. OK098]SHL96191.1 Uncharacterized conserved protein, contains predicted SAM-dependent methyltransferase domain [Mucilaginibacter sp. OK098]